MRGGDMRKTESTRAESHGCRWRPNRRETLAMIAAIAGVSLTSRVGVAFDLTPGSNALRESAIEAIPFQELTDESRQRISGIVNRPTIHRHLPGQTVECNPDIHLFLLRNPEIVVNMWQIMGATNMTLKRTGPFTFHSTDGMGTKSNLELVYGTPELHVLYGEGSYEGSLLKRGTTGRCVLVLRSAYGNSPEKRSNVSNALDLFLQLDNVGAEIVAKTLQPMLGKTVETNFNETAKFVGRVSQLVEKNAPGIERLARRLSNVDPETREEFVKVAAKVHAQAAMADAPAAHPGGRLSDAPSEVRAASSTTTRRTLSSGPASGSSR